MQPLGAHMLRKGILEFGYKLMAWFKVKHISGLRCIDQGCTNLNTFNLCVD